MKKFLVAIVAFLYLNINIDAPPGGERIHASQRTINTHMGAPRKNVDIPQQIRKGGSKQIDHLQNI